MIFAILSGNTDNAFALDASTGELTVQTQSALDFETTPSFSLEVEVSDGEFSTSATVTVNLNDVNESVLSIDHPGGEFTIYPNPVQNDLVISPDQSSADLVVTNISGQLMMQENSTDLSKPLNVRGLENGVYILLIKTDQQTIFKRFIKTD